jgi:hypothetical protein
MIRYCIDSGQILSRGLCFCTPNLCTPRSKRVLKTVRITPAHTGILNNMLNAKAVPNTVVKTICYSNAKHRNEKK